MASGGYPLAGMSATAAVVGFPVAVLGAAGVLVAAATGAGVGLPWVVLAGLVLAAAAVTGAGLASVAFARRDPWWGIGLVLAWPVAVPHYLRILLRRRRSVDAEV